MLHLACTQGWAREKRCSRNAYADTALHTTVQAQSASQVVPLRTAARCLWHVMCGKRASAAWMQLYCHHAVQYASRRSSYLLNSPFSSKYQGRPDCCTPYISCCLTIRSAAKEPTIIEFCEPAGEWGTSQSRVSCCPALKTPTTRNISTRLQPGCECKRPKTPAG